MTTAKEKLMIEAHRMGRTFAETCILNANALFRDDDARLSYLAGLIMELRRLAKAKYALTDRDTASIDAGREIDGMARNDDAH